MDKLPANGNSLVDAVDLDEKHDKKDRKSRYEDLMADLMED